MWIWYIYGWNMFETTGKEWDHGTENRDISEIIPLWNLYKIGLIWSNRDNPSGYQWRRIDTNGVLMDISPDVEKQPSVDHRNQAWNHCFPPSMLACPSVNLEKIQRCQPNLKLEKIRHATENGWNYLPWKSVQTRQTLCKPSPTTTHHHFERSLGLGIISPLSFASFGISTMNILLFGA